MATAGAGLASTAITLARGASSEWPAPHVPRTETGCLP